MTIQYQSPLLCIFESALYRTTSTIIHTEDCILIVDPNWLPQEVAILQNYVEQLPQNLPQYLLFTHSDYDHIIAYHA
ncbi:MAG: MBL fold metallo-hydrolase, partial [Bacteroidota bacterium]